MGKGIQRRVVTVLGLASALSIGVSACGDADDGGLTIGNGGSGASGGEAEAGSENGEAAAPAAGKGGTTNNTGGSSASGRGGGDAEGGEPSRAGSPGGAGEPAVTDAGAGGAPASQGGAGGDAPAHHGGHAGEDMGLAGKGGEGGAFEPGIGGEGGQSEGGAPGTVPRCVFHTDAPVSTGEGGAGGEAAAGPSITVEVSPFIGPYLADATGRTLYGYGADYVGDCETPPVSNCVADCLLSWPIFDAPVRTLAAGIDESAFGQITRADGLTQTTYFGWPLYYYKTDTAKGLINGQGKGKIWFAAETVLPNVNIMRASATAGGMRYLGDDRGRTLYTCTGSCAPAFDPFEVTQLLPVSYLEPADLTLFPGPSGGTQVAFRGQLLYTAVADTASGQLNGLAETNGALALP